MVLASGCLTVLPTRRIQFALQAVHSCSGGGSAISSMKLIHSTRLDPSTRPARPLFLGQWEFIGACVSSRFLLCSSANHGPLLTSPPTLTTAAPDFLHLDPTTTTTPVVLSLSLPSSHLFLRLQISKSIDATAWLLRCRSLLLPA